MGIENTGANEQPDKGTGWGAKAAKVLKNLSKKYPAPDKTTRKNKGSKQK